MGLAVSQYKVHWGPCWAVFHCMALLQCKVHIWPYVSYSTKCKVGLAGLCCWHPVIYQPLPTFQLPSLRITIGQQFDHQMMREFCESVLCVLGIAREFKIW